MEEAARPVKALFLHNVIDDGSGGQVLAGSAYRYSRMFAQALGGIEMVVAADLAEATYHLARINPELVIVRGDGYNLFRAPLERRIPYVLLCHDLAGMRAGRKRPHEDPMINNAGSILFASYWMRQWARGHFDIDKTTHHIVELKPFAGDMDFDPLPKLPGRTLVYSGGLAGPAKHGHHMPYRALHETFARFIADGIDVHLYPSRACPVEGYEELGCVLHEHVPEGRALLRELSQYGAGFLGYAGCEGVHLKYAHRASPNKTWLYLSSGIPTLAYNAGRGGRVAVRGGWGVCADPGEPCGKVFDRAMRVVIDDGLRRSQTIDGDLDVFTDLAMAALSRRIRPVRIGSRGPRPKRVRPPEQRASSVTIDGS